MLLWHLVQVEHFAYQLSVKYATSIGIFLIVSSIAFLTPDNDVTTFPNFYQGQRNNPNNEVTLFFFFLQIPLKISRPKFLFCLFGRVVT